MNLYDVSLPHFIKMLKNLDRWIEKAVDNAKARSFEPAAFLTSRLAPDQYPFTRQVQAACDAAKLAAARLTGKEAPKHPDTETTVEELRARIADVVAYLETFTAADFASAETVAITLPWMPGQIVRGRDYLFDLALANFAFHVTTAYAILRADGVPLGKADYIGGIKSEPA